MRNRVLFFIQLVTDLDLLLPLWDELISRKDPQLQPSVTVVAELLTRSPAVGTALTSRNIPFDVVTTEETLRGDQPDLHGLSALVTATETTLRPHRAANLLTQRANRAGIPTYTLQHGLENVGLTYFDDSQTPAMVEFASGTIFTWGPLEKLHPDVRPETRARCVPAGCCKAIERTPNLHRPVDRSRMVAVFENIHWLRYNDRYRSRFLSDLEHTARMFPDIAFLVKPHPGGKWMTSRYTGDLPHAGNLVIANPDDPAWAQYTATDIIGWADGVITTPSTIAVDSARIGCPVAVVAYDLQLAGYAPLKLLRSTGDWEEFPRCLEDQGGTTALKQNASEFLDTNLIPGDAAGRIIERIIADIRRILPTTANVNPELSSSEKPK